MKSAFWEGQTHKNKGSRRSINSRLQSHTEAVFFLQKEPGYEDKSHERKEVYTQLTVSYSAFPPRATQKKFSGSEPSWITTLEYVGCEGTSHTLTDSIQPSRVFHCSYFVISHDLSTNHYTHYITVMSWFVHQSESLHLSYTDRLNAIQTLKSIPLQPKTKCDKTLLQFLPQFIFPQINYIPLHHHVTICGKLFYRPW